MDYEITLWEELQKGSSNTNEYIEENCLCTLLQSGVQSNASIFNPIFTEEINGNKTLTFDIQYKYFDVKTNDYIDNPFIQYLKNGRIIKIKYDGKFNSFVITKLTKSSDKKVLSCTCSDLNIMELSKTGYNIELNTELENNMGNVFDLAQCVVDDTSWHIIDTNEKELSDGRKIKSDLIKAYRTEPLYVYELSTTETITNVTNLTTGETGITIPGNSIIYISQTTYLNANKTIQFLYNPNGLECDNKRVVINSDIYEAIVNWNPWPTLHTSASFVGRMLQSTPITKYVTEIDKVCSQYIKNSIKYYGFNDISFASSVDIQNIIANNTNYINADGWTPAVVSQYVNGSTVKNALTLKFSEGGGVIKNTGVNNSKAAFVSSKGFNKENDFVIALRVTTGNNPTKATLYYRSNDTDSSTALTPIYTGKFNFNPLIDPDEAEDLTNYIFAKLTYNGNAISYTDVLNSYIELQLEGNNDIQIIDAKFFKYATKTKNGQQYLVIPNLSLVDDEVIKNYTYIFKQSLLDINSEDYIEVSSINDLVFDWQGKTENLPNDYKLITNEHNQLITSIEVAESNRFNILQDLCEKFECWTNFHIDTNELGRVRYNYIPTQDDHLKSGKYYFIKLDGGSTIDFDDEHYKYANLNDYFDQCKSTDVYNYSEKDRYYQKIDNTYVAANLEHQWGESGTIFYIAEYTTETGTSKTTKTYKQATTYSSTEQYYIKNGNLYKAITLTNQFISNPTNYYKMNRTWNEIKQNLYERYYKKYITFNEYTGIENYSGFKYGINLNNIQRNLISDSLVTKLIVADNTNEYADNGYCSIAEASQNSTGSNTLYNFDYYLSQGLINETQFNKDMYGETDTDLAYLSKYIKLNANNFQSAAELAALQITVSKLNAQYQLYTNYLTQARTDFYNYVNDIKDITGTDGLNLNWTYDECKTKTRNIVNYPDKLNEYIDARDTANKNIENYTTYQKTLQKELEARNIQLANLAKSQTAIANLKKALDYEFYQKYSRFIHEGTWNSDDYYNADLYFEDASKVLISSAFPVVEYTFNVTDLSDLDKWSDYKINIGDKTYVEDIDFFSDQNTPKMEVVVSEIKWNLLNPSKTVVTVKNFKTQFQDLFQRVAAATQTLEYNENKYNYAADATTDTEKGGALIARMMTENNEIITKADGKFSYDEKGITAIDSNPQYQTRFTTRGLVLSDDGGETWKTGISAKGINADLLTAGQIDANKINIYGGASNKLFEWDKYGINAYTGSINDATNRNKYVRFDKFGIYGATGEAYDWQPTAISTIEEKAVFALTWNGFALNAINSGNYVRISTSGSPSGTITPEGKSALKKIIDAGTRIAQGTNPETYKYTSNFYVLEDGSLYAQNGTFKGHVEASSGYFTGTLKANAIQIKDGNNWVDILENNKIKNNYLDLGGIVIDGTAPKMSIYSSSTKTGAKVEITGTSMTLSSPDTKKQIKISDSGITITGYDSYDDSDVQDLLSRYANNIITTGTDPETGKYVGYTQLTGSYIYSPYIYGDVISVIGNTSGHSGTFQILLHNKDGSTTSRGYMGYAKGSTTGTITEGIAMTTGTPSAMGMAPLVIVTDAGARMTAGGQKDGASVYVTEGGAYYRQPGGSVQKIGVACFG